LGDKVKISAVKDMCQEMYASLEKNAEDCAECGECEEKCPYELPIREMLKEKHRLLVEG
jgi:predicted aldo/keto reductase-like oxidoreductase